MDQDWAYAGTGVGGVARPLPWFNELVARHDAGAMWAWQSRHLISRDLDRVIFCRPRWLSGEPLCVRIGPGWFASPGAMRIVKVTPRIKDSPSAELRLPLSPMEVREIAPGPARAERVVFRGAVTKPVKVVRMPAEVMQAVESDAIGRAIRRGLLVDVARGADGKPYIHASLQRSEGIPRDVITGLKIEFLLDGQVIAWGQVRPNAWLSETSNGWVHGDMGRIADTQRMQPYRARVTGSISSAIRNYGGEKYWVGSFECPLSDVIPPPLPATPVRATPIR
jgi:hypothetical protein